MTSTPQAELGHTIGPAATVDELAEDALADVYSLIDRDWAGARAKVADAIRAALTDAANRVLFMANVLGDDCTAGKQARACGAAVLGVRDRGAAS